MGPTPVRDVGRAVLEPGRAIAEAGESEAEHGGALGRVDHLVEPPFLEATVQMHMTSVGHHRAVDDPGKAPAVARDEGGWAIGLIAHDQGGVGLVEIGSRVGLMAAIGQQQVGRGAADCSCV